MKILFNLTFIAFVFVAIPFYSFAQINLKSGYIVTLKGDTVKGFIDYRSWDTNPTEFKFKKGNDQQYQKIDLLNTSAVGVDGLDYFEKHQVSISTDEIQIGKISTGIDTAKITDNVFLRVLAKGKHIALYSYTDELKVRFYYSETGINGAHEFTYHIFYPLGDPNHFVEVKSENQLFYLANKYNPAVVSQVRGTGYTKSDFMKIINLINGDEVSKQFKTGSKFKFTFFGGAGASSSVLKFRDYAALDNPSSNKAFVSPYITGGINIYPNKITQKLLIKLQLSFVPDQYEIHSIKTENAKAETILKFNQYTFAIAPQIIYNFYSGPTLKIYAGTGASFNFSSYKNYQYTFQTVIGVTSPTHFNFDSLWTAVPISVGIVIANKIDLNFYYYIPSTFTLYSGAQSNVTSYRAGFNYIF